MTLYNFGVTTNDDVLTLLKPKTMAAEKGWKPGDKVTVTLTGTVPRIRADFNFTGYSGGTPLYLEQREVQSAERTGKSWRPGDTIAVRYDSWGAEYTYVRGRANWPGDRFPLSDEKVDELYALGKVRHLLRDAQPVAA